ncbi:hypothetical protein BH11CYA1_BH11CYA1_01890 [soil metagenome]
MKVTNIAAQIKRNQLSQSLRLDRFRLSRVFAGFTLAIALSLPLGLSFANPSLASVSADVRLDQLEVKFFKHTFPKDEEAVRLERLEKMIFGEARTGVSETRLKNLADTVPNLGAATAEDAADKSESSSSGKPTTRPVNNSDSDLDLSEERSKSNKPGAQVLSGESKYPAVTALEQSIFKRDYASDPVAARLNRLETKVFGQPSKFTDLSERVDALKDKTRVDVAKQAPPGTDWLDDEDDDINFPAPKKTASQPVGRSDGEDGRSGSGRDLRKDMQAAFGNRSAAASGGYGMGGGAASNSSSNSASGGYGMGSIGSSRSAGRALDNEEDDDLPPVAPRRTASSGSSARGSYGSSSGASSASRASAGSARGDRFAADSDSDSAPASVPGGAIGLSSKVTALENAVLGKTFASDPLIDRVGHLEETVFPNKSDTAASLSLPERVAKLVEKVPIASASTKTAKANRSRRDPDFDDDLDMGSGMNSLTSMGGGMTSQTQTRNSGGLGKIINSIGNMLGGGYGSYGGYTSGYGMPATGAMVRDPSTGFLVDSMSGNLINPSTGQVVGRSAGYPAGAYGGYGSGFGGLQTGYSGFGMPAGVGIPTGFGMPMGASMGGYNSFNNGFSPYGYPSGGYGLNNSGIRFGGSNFGVRF